MHNQHKLLRLLRLISMLRAKPPRSIPQLSGILGCTERTAYRYLSLLDAAGFHVEKTDQGRFYLYSGDDNSAQIHFSPEEVSLMKTLLLTVGRNHRLKDSMLRKLYIHSEAEVSAGQLLKAHLGKMVETIQTAIQTRRQLLIRNYQSLHTNKVSDRIVEPVRFTDDYRNLAAFEIESGKNKFFNIERIASVELRKTPFRNAEKHRYKIPDVFGFQQTATSFEVELLLPLRAAVLLREEYPMTAACLQPAPGKNRFRFKAVVYDFKPVIRFVLGFLEEIEIVGGDAFKQELQQRISLLLRRKTRH